MFVSRLLLPAILVLTPWLSACSWGQNFTAMQKAYGVAGPAARQQFSLRNQATRPPMFADQQGNEYTAMSPDSWGHPATRRNIPQPRFSVPSYAAPTYSTAPAYSVASPVFGQPISPSQEIVHGNSAQQPQWAEEPELVSEQQPEFKPLTNTGDHRAESKLSNTADSDKPSLEINSNDDKPSKSPGDRYAQAEDFPFDGPGASVLKNSDDVPFPFTRKEPALPAAPSELLSGDSLLGGQPAVAPSVGPVLPTSPLQDPQSPIILDTQEVILPSASDSELGLYAKPRSVQPYPPQQSYVPQQSFQHQAPVLNQNQPFSQNQPLAGLDHGNEFAVPAGQWQHPGAGSYFQEGSRQQVPNWASMIQKPAVNTPFVQEALPNFRPDLGHRDAAPTIRNYTIRDDGKKFDHEKKKRDFPPFKEIIATGKFFYNAEVNAIRPTFLGNTGLSVDSAAFSESQPFEFATTYAPLIKFGFESPYGPGVELSYFNVTDNANTLGATSDGTGSVASIASITGPGRFTTITADAAGETLTADHSFELETFGLNFFKELKFPISRLNGKFGFLYANVAQSLLIDVSDAAGVSTDTLTNTTDFRGWGPQFALEYFRPVGHTPLTLVTQFGGKGLFGRRDQFVSNDEGAVERRFGADEFITVIDFAGGVQVKKLVADGRYWTGKVGYVHQSWLGGGTAVDPQGDFGLRGFVFSIGYNR